MRVLFFIPGLHAGGAERVISTLANHMANIGDEVRILTFDNGKSFYKVESVVTINGMNIEFRGSKHNPLVTIKTEFLRRKNFIKEVQKFKPDVVVSFLYTSNVIAISSQKRIDCPIIISERNDPTKYKFWQRMLFKTLYPKSNGIVCQSNKVAEFYCQFNAKCHVISNPLNSSGIGKPAMDRKKSIVSVGRLVAAKNHDMLIKAFAKVNAKFPGHTLEIYGEGPLQQELQELIDTLNLSDTVKLCGEKKNVFKYVSDYTCFVLSSDYEGFPNVLLEAMASGMPVVSTDFDTGVARDLIKDGENGYLVNVGDVEDLCDAIGKIISSKELQNKMSNNNLYVREKFSEDKICDEWRELILSFCNTSGRQ